MRPRYEDASTEAYNMLKKAHSLVDRLDTLEKAKMCPCGSGKPQASCCPDMKKGDHHKSQTFGTEPENAQFMIETGGQTYNAFYNTNQNLLESADIANKGATSESINLDAMPMNERGNQKGRLVEG
jgi:uncharacterized protein YchJ